jgi:hypothetical protein
VGLVFLYSGIFSAQKDNHPVPSFFEEITGRPSPSAGMSRAFSEIIRGETASALEYNPDSLRIFAFFLIQGIQRLAVSFLLILTAKTGHARWLKVAQESERDDPRETSKESLPGRKTPFPGKSYVMRILLPADAAASLLLFLYCFRGQIRALIELLAC